MKDTNYRVSFILSDKNPQHIIRDYNLNLVDKEDLKDEIYFTSPLELKAYLDFFEKDKPLRFNDMYFHIQDININITDGKIIATILLLDEEVHFTRLVKNGNMYGEVWR